MTRQTPVLIVGAGPAGLAAAVTLARHGVRSLLVERRPELSALPRATVLSTRTMELLRSWGLEEQVLAAAVDVEWVGWESPTLAEAPAGTPFPVGYPTREQSAVISPSAPACVAQDELEPLLLDHLRSLPAARAELGTEVTEVSTRDDGVRAVLRDGAHRRDPRRARALRRGGRRRPQRRAPRARHRDARPRPAGRSGHGTLPGAPVGRPGRPSPRDLLRDPPGAAPARSSPRAAATAGSSARTSRSNA